MRSAALFPVAFALALGGCSRTDSGSGTGTIFAVVEVAASSESTNFEARLVAHGAPLLDAVVTMHDHDSSASTTLISEPSGLYRAVLPGYVRTVDLSVVSGRDNLQAVLEGPAPHTITRPPNGARVTRTGFTSLKLKWDADDLAERVEITIGSYVSSVDGDIYETEVPLAPLMNGDLTLAVTRETHVDLAGGAAGSRMRSRYRAESRFTLQD